MKLIGRPRPKTFPGLGGFARPYDGNTLTNAVHVDRHLLLEADTECNQHDDRHRAPDDAEHRQERTQLLRPKVENKF